MEKLESLMKSRTTIPRQGFNRKGCKDESQRKQRVTLTDTAGGDTPAKESAIFSFSAEVVLYRPGLLTGPLLFLLQ